MIRLLSALPTTVLIDLLLLNSSSRKQDENQQEHDYQVIAHGIRLTQLRDLAQLDRALPQGEKFGSEHQQWPHISSGVQGVGQGDMRPDRLRRQGLP